MNVTLTDTLGSWWTLASVESIRLVGQHAVEIKTFGNEPVVTRNIQRFTVHYDSATVFAQEPR
jgi:hypothetical protein